MRVKKYVVIMMAMMMVLLAGCGTKKGVQEDVLYTNGETDSVVVDWENVYEAIEAYDMESNGYYVSSSYREDAEEMNYLDVTNYNPDEDDAFQKVDYQLSISYGEMYILGADSDMSETYKDAVVEISIFADEYYVAVYSPEGEFLDEEGSWFLDEDKDVFMQEKMKQAQEMFGLSLIEQGGR